MATSIPWTSRTGCGPGPPWVPRGPPVGPPAPYQHAGAEQEAVDGLGDVGRVDLVVVGVPVLSVAGLQRVQQRGQEDGGDLRRGARALTGEATRAKSPAPGPGGTRGHGRTLKRLLRLCRVKSSKTMVLSEWSSVTRFSAKTSKHHRSRLCEGGGRGGITPSPMPADPQPCQAAPSSTQ